LIFSEMPLIMHSLFRLLAGVLVFGLAASTGVCETKVTPSIGVRGAYDDNTLGQGESDAELMLSPAFKVERKSEVTSLLLQGRLDAFQYLDEDEFNRENQTWRGRLP
jgi:hypothetical protein